jgi:hypothetical protein
MPCCSSLLPAPPLQRQHPSGRKACDPRRDGDHRMVGGWHSQGSFLGFFGLDALRVFVMSLINPAHCHLYLFIVQS